MINIKWLSSIKLLLILMLSLLKPAGSLLLAATHFDLQSKLLNLSQTHQSALQEFLIHILSDTECGYVLYGNKPVCFMSMMIPGEDGVGKVGHYHSVAITQGMRTWENLELPKKSKNYILHIHTYSPDTDRKYAQFLLINRPAFCKVVNENMTLFQYILGHQVTAEKLLTKFLNPHEDFFSVLNDNKVLIGIVLGFGVTNALHVNRQELIRDSLTQEKINASAPSNDKEEIATLELGFGYRSILEEHKDLNQKISCSSYNLEKESPKFYFGCLADSEESINLIKHYEDVQVEIIKTLESENFLEKVLGRFYGTEMPPLNLISISNPTMYHQTLWNKLSFLGRRPFIRTILPIDWSLVIAYSIQNKFFDGEVSNEEKDSFIEGMYAAERTENALFYDPLKNMGHWNDLSVKMQVYSQGFRTWAHYKEGHDIYALDTIIQSLNNIQQEANLSRSAQITLHTLLNQLHYYLYQQQQKKENEKVEQYFCQKETKVPFFLRRVIKDRLYYQSLTSGEGNRVCQDHSVKLKYCIKNLSGDILGISREQGTEIDLRRTMTGLRLGLESLRIGSKGTLYLHPTYGFRDHDYLLPIKPFLIIDVEIVSAKISFSS